MVFPNLPISVLESNFLSELDNSYAMSYEYGAKSSLKGQDVYKLHLQRRMQVVSLHANVVPAYYHVLHSSVSNTLMKSLMLLLVSMYMHHTFFDG